MNLYHIKVLRRDDERENATILVKYAKRTLSQYPTQFKRALNLLSKAEALGSIEAKVLVEQLTEVKEAVTPVTSYDGIIDYLANNHKKHSPFKSGYCMIGILFFRPGTPLYEKILIQLEYIHHRSSNLFDLFIAGYDETPWSNNNTSTFSAEKFNKVVMQLEEHSKWAYSGGTELILTNVRLFDRMGLVSLDFSSSIILNLDDIEDNGSFKDLSYFFEYLIRLTRYINFSRNPTWEFSDLYFRKRFSMEIFRKVLEKIPLNIGKSFREVAGFSIKDISKPNKLLKKGTS